VVQMMVACMDVSHRLDTYFNGYLHTLSHEYNGMEYNPPTPLASSVLDQPQFPKSFLAWLHSI